MKHFKFLMPLILIVNFNLMYGQSQTIKAIKLELDSIWQTDQGIRFELMDLQEQGKMQTEEFRNLVKKMKKNDSINLKKIKSILDTYGWPDELEFQGNQTIFLVIQHADLETQEEYLPVIRKAVKNGKTLPSNLALLEDRIALRQGKKQIYGSQIYIDSKTGKKYVQPLLNPENVDKRRAEVGLAPMDQYLKRSFQMEWDIEKYEHNLPEIEKLLEDRRKEK